MHETIRLRVGGEAALKEGGKIVASAVIKRVDIVQRQSIDIPVEKHLVIQADLFNALAVVQLRAVIHAAHGLHEDVDAAAVRQSLDGDKLFLIIAVDHSVQLAVDIDIGAVRQAVDEEPGCLVRTLEIVMVENKAEILAVILHAARHHTAMALADLRRVM